MHWIDYTLIALYIGAMIGIGLWAQRRAGNSIDHYFLGDKSIPWWMLGASGMASNLDVSGTLIIAALVYAMGMEGFYIFLRGDVVLALAFFMVFMGKWNRRSNVMTNAEWMEFRFGDGKQGQAARVLAAVANIVFSVWVVTYFAAGAGVFLGTLLGIDPDLATVGMVALASIYTIASGLYGVVYTDVFQGFLIFGVIVFVIVKVMTEFTIPDEFMISVPLGGGEFQELLTTRAAWTNVLPSWNLDLPGTYAQYNAIGFVGLYYLFRSTVDGMSAPGGYMVQRYFAAKDERSAGLLSLIWILLMTFRWPFVAAIAIMGITLGTNGTVIANPEEVLPVVLMELFPVGIKGLLVAGLIAAAMSTFDSVVNAGASYWVKDLYQRFLRPEASGKSLVLQSRLASALIVIVGTAFVFLFESLNEVWGFLTLGLGVGLIVPQFLRWYWGRFNGYGYAGGTAAGMILAFGIKGVEAAGGPVLDDQQLFFTTFFGTLIACIGITLATEPTATKALVRFYRQTRPFGFWDRARALTDPAEVASIRAESRRDIAAIFVAVPWQLCLFMAAMVFVTKTWATFFTLFAIFAVLSVLLYLLWYRHLSPVGWTSEAHLDDFDAPS